MLNFRNTLILFFVTAVSLAIAAYSGAISYFWLAVPVALFIIITAYGSARVDSGFFIQTVCSGDQNSRMVALTFDDGPVSGKTEKILDILNRNSIKAAFFCIGKKMEQNPELLKRIQDEGHLVGNHSYSHHPMIDLYPFGRLREELIRTNQIARKITGKELKLFRPPYGVTTPPLARAVSRTGMTAIGWNIRSLDTVINDSQKLISRTTGNVKGGDIILLHDTSETTISSLQVIIDKIRNKGLEFARLDQLTDLKPYA